MSLLEVVANPSLGLDKLHKIEGFGRKSSSTGFTIVVLGLFVSSCFTIQKGRQMLLMAAVVVICVLPFILTPYYRETLVLVGVGACVVLYATCAIGALLPKIIVSVIGISLLTWPAFYNGKLAVVDYFLIDPSLGAQRLSARYVPILRQGLFSGYIQLQDISFKDGDGIKNPEAKAFLVMLGPLAIHAESLLSWVSDDAHMQEIVEGTLNSRYAVNINKEYTKYLNERSRFITEVYNEYADRSKAYIERDQYISEESDKQWLAVQQEVDEGWERYERGRESFLDRHVDAVNQEYMDKLRRFFKYKGEAKRIKDYERRKRRNELLDERYYDEMRRLINPPPPWEIFCIEANDVVSQLEDFLNTALSLGTRKAQTYTFVDDVRFAGARLAVYNGKQFEEDRSNPLHLPFSMDSVKYIEMSEEEYDSRAEISDYVRKELIKKDLNLDNDWKITDTKAYHDAFYLKADRDIKRSWNDFMYERFGAIIPPGLSLDEFTLQKPVQRKLEEELGENYVTGFIFSWSEAELMQKVVKPRIANKIKHEIEVFRRDSSLYDNGARYEEEGKDAMRAALVPPIAVALSLFFGFMSGVKLVISFLSIITSSLIKKKKYQMCLIYCVWVLSVLVVILMPFVITNKYAESEGWKILSEETYSVSPPLSIMTEYTIRVHPILAKVGYPLMRVFDPYDMRPD